MRIKELLGSIDRNPGAWRCGDFEVRGVTCNSKDARDGFVFVAVKGARADGNSFIDDAVNNGARAVVYQGQAGRLKGKCGFIKVKDSRKAAAQLACAFYHDPSAKIRVVGVTGTNGKTTITYLLEAIARQAGRSPAVIGTINYHFKNRVIPAKNTTPGPVELQSLLAQMRDCGVDYCFMEASSHALDQERTEGINFYSAIFTNLTQDHLDYHKTMENYYKAKERLFKDISRRSFIVVNNDDKYGMRLKRASKARLVTYGINTGSRVMAKDIIFDCSGSRFTLASKGVSVPLRTGLIGRHNIYNVLAACAWAMEEGFGVPVIQRAIAGFDPVRGRLERVGSGAGFSVFVDYAHTEDALNNVIRSLRQLSGGRIIVVFGCGGDRDKAKRPKMGRVVTDLADYAVITNDNPRSEDPASIIRDIRKGIKKDNFCILPDRARAIKKSLLLAKSGDIVLVAGKGHEDYQVLKNKTVHFDDREAVNRCLRSMNY